MIDEAHHEKGVEEEQVDRADAHGEVQILEDDVEDEHGGVDDGGHEGGTKREKEGWLAGRNRKLGEGDSRVGR